MLRLAIRQNHLRATTVAAVRCGLKASAVRTYFSGGSSAKPLRQRPSFGAPPVYSCWLATGSPLAAEIIANVYDAVVIDGQHGIGDTAAMLTALSAAPTPPIAIVRVSKLCDGEIAKALDAGAHALICPMINSVKEADAFVKAAMYPPRGHRSFGPHRAILPHIAAPTGSLGDWVRNENANVKTFAMIETRGGLDDLEAILQVPGLTGVFIGPNDLSLCLGAEPSSAPEGEVLGVSCSQLSPTDERCTNPRNNNWRYIEHCPASLRELGLLGVMYDKWPEAPALRAVVAEHALARVAAPQRTHNKRQK